MWDKMASCPTIFIMDKQNLRHTCHAAKCFVSLYAELLQTPGLLKECSLVELRFPRSGIGRMAQGKKKEAGKYETGK